MKINNLLMILASGVVILTVASCGSSSNSSSATPVLTPSATPVTNPPGTTISGFYNSIPTGCSNDVCTIQVPTGNSAFESITAPSSITSANQIYAAWYNHGNVALVDTQSVVYVTTVPSSITTSKANNSLTTTTWLSAAPQSGIEAFTDVAVSGGTAPYVAGSTLLNDGLIASAIATESTAVVVAQTGTDSCSTTSGVTAPVITMMDSPINSITYAGIGLSNGQVCVANVTSRSGFQNLTSSYAQAASIYGNESSPVVGISFYQSSNSTACSGYWFNSDASIWGVNATCGSSISPISFTELSSPSKVSGTIPHNPTAMFVGSANGLYVGGYSGSLEQGTAVPTIYYLTPGTNIWTSSSISSASGFISNISPTTTNSVVYITVCPNLELSAPCSGYNITLQ